MYGAKLFDKHRKPNIRRPLFSTGIFKERPKEFRISNKTFREADVKVKIIHINDLQREKEQHYVVPYSNYLLGSDVS